MAAVSNRAEIAALATCAAVLCGAGVLWHTYKERLIQRKLAEDVRVSRLRAEQGDANAQYNLGKMYFQGRGVSEDYAVAARWYRKAAEQGEAQAQNNLAFMYSQGKGVPRDYTESARWYRKAAEQGDAHAEYGLGFEYHYGLGVPPNPAEAVRWYRKAADQGYVMALSSLGYMYYHGQGVPRNRAEAVRWFGKAADRGDEEAQVLLGYLYYHGQDVPQSYAEAARWFAKGIGQAAAVCFARAAGGTPLARWTSVLAILFALPILVPKRRWGRAIWLPSAFCSAMCAAGLVHVLLSPSSLTLLAQILPASIFGGLGRVLWISLLAGGSAICAIAAVMDALRASKRGGEPDPSLIRT